MKFDTGWVRPLKARQVFSDVFNDGQNAYEMWGRGFGKSSQMERPETIDIDFEEVKPKQLNP